MWDFWIGMSFKDKLLQPPERPEPDEKLELLQELNARYDELQLQYSSLEERAEALGKNWEANIRIREHNLIALKWAFLRDADWIIAALRDSGNTATAAKVTEFFNSLRFELKGK